MLDKTVRAHANFFCNAYFFVRIRLSVFIRSHSLIRPLGFANFSRAYSISKSFVTRRRAADSAIARQGEVDKVTDDLEMELRAGFQAELVLR